MINKSANINVRIEPSIKKQAEAILSELGIPVSFAINQLYRQIIIHNGLPFDVKMPPKPRGLEDMSNEELKMLLDERVKRANEEKGLTIEKAFDDVLKDS